jgi:hypothetical protein
MHSNNGEMPDNKDLSLINSHGRRELIPVEFSVTFTCSHHGMYPLWPPNYDVGSVGLFVTQLQRPRVQIPQTHVKAGTLAHFHNILIKTAVTIMRVPPQPECLTLRKQYMLPRTLGVWELCTTNRNIKLTRHYGNVYEGSSNNLKIELLHSPALLVMGINLYHSSKHTQFIIALFIIARLQNQVIQTYG